MTSEKVKIKKKKLLRLYYKKKMVKLLMIGLAANLTFGFVWAHTEQGNAEIASNEAEQEAKKDEAEDNQAEREEEKALEALATIPAGTQFGVGTYVVCEDITSGTYQIRPTIEEDVHEISCEIDYGGEGEVVPMNMTVQNIELDNGDVITVTENCNIKLIEQVV